MLGALSLQSGHLRSRISHGGRSRQSSQKKRVAMTSNEEGTKIKKEKNEEGRLANRGEHDERKVRKLSEDHEK